MTEVAPRLQVGGTQEVVNVTAEAPQINYVSPEFAPTIDQTAISSLPTASRVTSAKSITAPNAN